MTDSILNTINDASDTLAQFNDDTTGIDVMVPITALRWLTHAASMHYTRNDAGPLYRIDPNRDWPGGYTTLEAMIHRGVLVEVGGPS